MNLLGILTGTILNFALAFLWYGNAFKKPWRKLTGRTPDEKPAKSQMLLAVAYAVMMSVGADLAVNALGIATVGSALVAGLVVGVLMLAPTILSEWIWDKKPMRLILINTGFYALYFVLLFAVMVLMKRF